MTFVPNILADTFPFRRRSAPAAVDTLQLLPSCFADQRDVANLLRTIAVRTLDLEAYGYSRIARATKLMYRIVHDLVAQSCLVLRNCLANVPIVHRPRWCPVHPELA